MLFDPGRSGGLEDFVTICVKTFERYPCLTRLLKSIRAKYPKIEIIIADDSFNYREIEGYEGLTQYRMPGGVGFNKGKNLAISQVNIFNVLNLFCCYDK